MLFVLPQCLHPSRSGTRLNRSTKWKRHSTKRAQPKRMSPHHKRLPLLRKQPQRTNHPHLQNVKKSSPIHKKSPVTQKNKSLQNYSFWSYFALSTANFLHKRWQWRWLNIIITRLKIKWQKQLFIFLLSSQRCLVKFVNSFHHPHSPSPPHPPPLLPTLPLSPYISFIHQKLLYPDYY